MMKESVARGLRPIRRQTALAVRSPSGPRRIAGRLGQDLRHPAAAVRARAVAELARRGGRHLHCVAPLLLDAAGLVRRAALRAATERPFAAAFGAAWQLYRNRRRFGLDRRERLAALAVTFRADPELALYMFAAEFSKRAWFGRRRRALRECHQQIAHTLATYPHPLGHAALRYYAQHARGRVRRLCRFALARIKADGLARAFNARASA